MEQALGKSSDDVLAAPRSGGRSLTSSERRTIDLSSKIVGWGSDLDPAVRPGVPMDKAPDAGIETLYPDFAQQVPRRRVHKSTEHAKLTPVFGNVCPPRGLSGKIRDVAYGLSEGRLSRWILLMAADRIDVVEDVLIDLAHLRIPNIPKEMGLKSELKYNRKAFAKKVALVAVGLLAMRMLMRRRTMGTTPAFRFPEISA